MNKALTVQLLQKASEKFNPAANDQNVLSFIRVVPQMLHDSFCLRTLMGNNFQADHVGDELVALYVPENPTKALWISLSRAESENSNDLIPAIEYGLRITRFDFEKTFLAD